MITGDQSINRDALNRFAELPCRRKHLKVSDMIVSVSIRRMGITTSSHESAIEIITSKWQPPWPGG